MPFPQFKGKHIGKALIEPGDFEDSMQLDRGDFLKNIVITYQVTAMKYFRKRYAGRYQKIPFVNSHQILKYGDVGIIRMNGVGAPHAVSILEELIVSGGRRFLSVGFAGGLQKPGIFLCKRAIRDEGTSYHYLPPGKYTYPDKELTSKFGEALKKNGIDFSAGTSWTIDAPYRETQAEVLKYKNQGVSTVEMEASALFAVARVRGVAIAVAFVVSDILGGKWVQRFKELYVRKALNDLVDVSLECLGGIK